MTKSNETLIEKSVHCKDFQAGLYYVEVAVGGLYFEKGMHNFFISKCSKSSITVVLYEPHMEHEIPFADITSIYERKMPFWYVAKDYEVISPLADIEPGEYYMESTFCKGFMDARIVRSSKETVTVSYPHISKQALENETIDYGNERTEHDFLRSTIKAFYKIKAPGQD